MAMFSIFEISASALRAQAQRLNVTATNLANVDSVTGPDGQPFRARQVVFEARRLGNSEVGGVEVARITEDDAPFRLEYRPGHPLANAQGYVRMPNVEPVNEMVNMISASRSYQANIEVLNTSKQLILKTLSLGEG